MTDPNRLLFVTTSLDRGGAQRQIVDLATRLVGDHVTVGVLSMTSPTLYVDELLAHGVEVLTLGMTAGRPTPNAFIRYGRILHAWGPDLVHSHMVHANLLARLGRVFAPRVPLICTVHNVSEGARWREVAYRVTDRLATRTTAVSEAAARRYVEVKAVPRRRISVVPNGIDFSTPADPHTRSRLRAELGVEAGFLWLAAGRLDVQKGFDLLLEAFDIVRRSHPTVRLAIAGEGPERIALELHRDRLGLESSVSLLGDRSDVPALLAAADGFVMSSRWEGLPMILLEAAGAELPIVATDVGGNHEVVVPDLGGVLTAVDPGAIAAGMEQVLAESSEARANVGAAHRSLVQDRFDLSAIVERWRAIYRHALARPGGS